MGLGWKSIRETFTRKRQVNWRNISITLIDFFYAQPRSLSAMPAFHILVIWAILSPSNCIT
jgi:hypothetical protein